MHLRSEDREIAKVSVAGELPTCLNVHTLQGCLRGTLACEEVARAQGHLSTCSECSRMWSEAAAQVVAADTSEVSRRLPAPLRAAVRQGAAPRRARFEQRELIAAGGTALVYRGYDRRAKCWVAIKRLKPWLLQDTPELLSRFAREARILRQLVHPNIVRLLGMLPDAQSPGIVLEYVEGGSLRQRLKVEQRLPLQQALAIALELADALSRAHHLGVIHRDIKPDNVLLGADGAPRLTDFGLARFVEQGTSLSRGVVGTVAYLSPEALWGRPLDSRADLWGLGALLFEMIAGRRAFEAEVPGAVIGAILHQPVPDLARLRPDAPGAVVQLVERLLHKDRALRPRCAREVGAELDALLQRSRAQAAGWPSAPR